MDTKSLFKKAVNLLTLSSFLLWNLAAAAPEGGSVAQGSATISQSGAQTTINQTSQNAVINWNSFNTASHESVQFNQPNANAVALNRITNGLPTEFAGQLKANGQVWILNPAGVLFTDTARVDVAGLVATTHGILDANFMAGHYQFDLVPGSEYSSIINNGLISAKDSGIVALVAPHVANNGLIQVNLGKVSLSSGAAYTLDMYGDNLINFGSNAPIQNGSVSNAGTVIANGGKVYMTANYAAGVLDNMISMSGTVQAKSVGMNSKGEIVLFGGNQQTKKLAGVTKVTGKLDASDGGFIETSGAYLDIRSSAVINTGVGGTWLLDPYNITVVAGAGLTNNSGAPNFTPSGTSTIGADLINAQLNGLGNVTLDTGVAGGDVGDININAPLTWTSFGTGLTLIAAHDITIAAAITWNSGGSLTLNAGNNIMINGPLSYTNNNLNTGNILMTAGGDIFLNSPISFINVPPHSFDLNLNAGGDIIMNSTVTNDVPLGSLVPFPFVHYTATGDILINSQFLITNSDQKLVVHLNAGNEVHFNADQSLPGSGTGGTLNVTATNGIFINTPFMEMGFGSSFPSFEFFSPVHLLQDTQLDGQVLQVDSTIDGAFNLTLNFLAYEFRDNIGSGTPLTSLTVSGAPFRATGSIASITTTGLQTYNDNFFFFGIPGMTFNASKVILNNGLSTNQGTGAIVFNSDLELTGQFGSLLNDMAGDTTITGSTLLHNSSMYIGGALISPTGAELHFMGPVTVSGNATIRVRNPGFVEFHSTVDGTGSLAVNDNGLPGGGPGYAIVDDVMDTSSMSAFNIPFGALYLNGGTIITNNHSYGAFLIMVVTALNGTLTDTGTVTVFNIQSDGLAPPGGLTINGNAQLSFVGSSYPLTYLYVSGTTTGTIVTTVGDQDYIGPFTLTQDDTLISTAGSIHFHDTVDGDGLGPWDLTVSAVAGTVDFRGDVGATNVLDALNVTAGTGIYLNNGPAPLSTFEITTAGLQSYTGDVILGYLGVLSSVGIVNVNAGGDITFNNQLIAPDAGQQGVAVYMVSAGDVYFKDNILMDPGNTQTVDYGGYLEVTAGPANNIYLGTFGDLSTLLIQNGNIAIPTSGVTQSLFFHSPVILEQNTDFRLQVGGVFEGTIDSQVGNAYDMSLTTGVNVSFNAPIGSINPLQSLTIVADTFGIRSGTESQNIPLGGIPFMSITTIGNQDYSNYFAVQVYQTVDPNSNKVTFTSLAGTITFNTTSFLAFPFTNVGLQVIGPDYPLLSIHGNVTFNADAWIRGTSIMDTGTVTLNGVGGAGALIDSVQTQQYDGIVVANGTNNVIHVDNTNQITSSNVNFTNTSTLGGPGGLTIDIAQTGEFNGYINYALFSNAAGAPLTFLSVTADQIIQTAGAIIANSVITNSKKGTDLSAGANQINFFNAFNDFFNDIVLVNTASPLTITGITQNGDNIFVNNDVNINNTGAISIIGTITATVPNNTVTLTSTDSITQSSSGVVNVYELMANSNTGIDLSTAANTISFFNAVNNISGNIDLVNTAAPLTITGITQLVGDVSIVNTGNIQSNGTINSPTNTVTLEADAGNINTLSGDIITASLVTISDFGQSLTGTTINNFNATNNVSGGIFISSPNAINVTGVSQNVGSFVAFAGSITQTGAITVSGNTLVSVGSNGILDLYNNGGSNNFQGSVALTSGSNTNILIFNNANLNLGNVSGGADFTAEVSGGNTITLNSAVTTNLGSQFYNSPVIINGFPIMLNASNTVQFNSMIDGTSYDSDYLRVNNANLLVFNGDIGATTPLSILYTSSVVTTQINAALVHVALYQEYEGDVQMQAGTVRLQTDYNGPIDSCGGCLGIFFDGTVTSPNTDLRASGDLTFSYYGSAPTAVSLNSLTVDSGMTTLIVQGNLTTTNNQDYGGAVYLIDYGYAMPVTLTSTNGTMIFRDVIISDTFSGSGPVDLTINGNATFKADIGPNPVVGGFNDGEDGRLNVFSVNGNIINFDTSVSQVNSLGTQTYTGTGINPLMTIGVDPVFTAPNHVIAIPLVVAADTFYVSTVGDVEFQNTVDGPANLTVTPTGTAIFTGDIGASVPLGSLTVNGTSTFNSGSAQTVTTNGSQIYTNTVTLLTDVTMTALDSGAFGANRISFGYGAAGVSGPGFSLTAITNNPANGPTGFGIEGTVDVGTFIMGGTGGGDISPITVDSFVAGQGGDNAWNNTLILLGATGYYCVNAACTPAPAANPFFNIPPVEIFNIPTPVTCDGSGCSNLEMMIDNLVEAGVVSCGGIGGCGFGFMQAQDTNGVVRILMPGDVVYAGDKILKDENSCGCVKSLYTNKKVCMGPKSLGQVYKD